MNYLFPYELVKEKSKVVIYGSGEVGYDFYQQIVTSGYCDILAWVDRQYEWYQYLGLSVTAPDKIDWTRADAVVIAVTNPRHFRQIQEALRQQGVSENCIFWKEDYKLQDIPVAHLDEKKRNQEAERARRCDPRDLLTEKRLDLVIRYMYAQEFLHGIANGEGCHLYTKFIEMKGIEEPLSNKVFAFFSDYRQKNGVQAYKDSFQSLMESMKVNGFQKEYFIPLDKYGGIINGAHRLAVSLALDLPVWVVDFPLFEGFGVDFSAEWMQRHDFEKKEIDRIKCVHGKILSKRAYFVKEQLKDNCYREKKVSHQNKWQGERMDKNTIPVIFSTNDKYVPYLGVALLSLIENLSSDCECRIYILYREMSEYHIFRLEEMSTDHVFIQCVDVSEQLKDKNYYGGPVEATKHISEETFYRLLIPEVLPQYKKILYLDCDLIILGDAAKLYETDLQGNIFGAVYSVEHWNQKRTGTVPNADPQEWFNAGVLLIDMERFQAEGCLEQCKELMSRQVFDVVDQDVLRIVGYGKTLYLPYEWNVMWHHLQSDINGLKEYNREIYLEVVRHPEIVHYTSGLKPWNRPKGALAHYFWKYARQSEFYEEILYQNLNGGIEEEENIFGTHLFPFDQIPRGADIILYGAGNVGKTLKKQVKATGWCNITAWSDKKYMASENRKLGLIPPENIVGISSDFILIAIDSEETAAGVREELIRMGVKKERIYWHRYRKAENKA